MLGEYRRRVRICRDWWQRCLKNGELPPAGPARGVFVLMCLRTGWYANTVTARGSRRRGIWPGNLDNTQGSRNQATQDMENVTLNGPQCKTQNTIPLPPPPAPEAVPRSNKRFFFPYPVHGSYYPSDLRSRKADEQRPQRSGSPTLDSSDSCDSAAQTHLASERPTTARLNIVG